MIENLTRRTHISDGPVFGGQVTSSLHSQQNQQPRVVTVSRGLENMMSIDPPGNVKPSPQEKKSARAQFVRHPVFKDTSGLLTNWIPGNAVSVTSRGNSRIAPDYIQEVTSRGEILTRVYRSPEYWSGQGRAFSDWYTVSSGPNPQGYEIAAAEFNLVGDRVCIGSNLNPTL